MCKTQDKIANIPLTIQNTAEIKNTYDIRAKIGLTTITFDPLTLRGKEQQVLNLGVPLREVPSGDHDVVFKTTSRRGNEQINTPVAFHALVCGANQDDSYSNLWYIIPLVLIFLLIVLGIVHKKQSQKEDG